MRITEAELNKTYVIKKIHTTGALKQRLMSFGVLQGVDILYLNSTNFKNTYKIQIGDTCIALRSEEANSIEIY